MKNTLFKSVLGVVVALGFSTANAELFVNPITKSKTGAGETSVHFGTSSVDYDFGGGSGDIDRDFIGATYAHGLNSSFDVYGTFSYTLKSKLENSTSDGSGFILGGGVRGGIPNDMGVSLHGYGQFLLIDEDYGNSLDGQELAMMVGVVASKALDSKIKIYGGAEFNLYSDIDIESVNGDRDDLFGFRIGANLNLGEFLLNANLSLAHEQGLFLSGSKSF